MIMNATTMERISANDTCSMRPRNWSRKPCLRDSASNNADFSRLFFYFAVNCHRFVYVSGVGGALGGEGGGFTELAKHLSFGPNGKCFLLIRFPKD